MLCVRAASPPALTQALRNQGGTLEVACVNGPRDVVLTGAVADANEALVNLKSSEQGSISCRELDVPFAFHSSQVDCVLDVFQEAISGVTFHTPRIPVICPRKERVLRQRDGVDASHLVDHFRGQVNLPAALESARGEGLVTDDTLFLEIGHNGSVTSMFKSTLGNAVAALPSLMKKRDAWATIVPAVNLFYQAGLGVKWNGYHRGFENAMQVLPLPHYKWDLQRYWIPYRNDWSLRKGDAVSGIAAGSSTTTTLLSTSIHRVVREEPFSESGTIVLLSDMTAPELHPVLQGHKINGVPLASPVCTSLKSSAPGWTAHLFCH